MDIALLSQRRLYGQYVSVKIQRVNLPNTSIYVIYVPDNHHRKFLRSWKSLNRQAPCTIVFALRRYTVTSTFFKWFLTLDGIFLYDRTRVSARKHPCYTAQPLSFGASVKLYLIARTSLRIITFQLYTLLSYSYPTRNCAFHCTMR